MKKILYWIPTSVFLIVFGFLLVFFHALQYLGLKIFGYEGQRNAVDGLMWCLNHILKIVGYPFTVDNQAGDLPTDKPMIIVSNHQGMFDISMIGVHLRKHHPKYVSKASLATGIPSISFNLRHGGSVLIDRKNGREAIVKIKEFCQYLKKHNRAGVIFPEGTRTRNGKMLPFKPVGLKVMLKELPEAIIVPVALQNFWTIEKYNLQPVPFGKRLKCTILPPIDRSQFKNNDEIVDEIERQIKSITGDE